MFILYNVLIYNIAYMSFVFYLAYFIWVFISQLHSQYNLLILHILCGYRPMSTLLRPTIWSLPHTILEWIGRRNILPGYGMYENQNTPYAS